MKEKLLHTPEGVRDIYNSECKRKSAVEKRIHHILELYGYQDIETPTFEFFDIFNSDTGTVSSVEMFKFFDRNNNTLVLRPISIRKSVRPAARKQSIIMMIPSASASGLSSLISSAPISVFSVSLP